MNDFTKEELGSIFLDMNHNILKHGVLNVANEYLDLRDKVERMIDNYCEHPINNVCMECLSATCEICNKIYGLKDE